MRHYEHPNIQRVLEAKLAWIENDGNWRSLVAFTTGGHVITLGSFNSDEEIDEVEEYLQDNPDPKDW